MLARVTAPAARPLARVALLPVAVCLAVLLAFAPGCARERANEATSRETPPLESADDRVRAPEVALADLEGDTLRLSDHRGKVVLLGFWATWCGPCRREVPRLKTLQAEYASRGLVVLGLSVDREGADVVRAFVREHGVTWPNAVADEAVIASFGSVDAIPTTYVIDREGNIAHRFVGLQSEERLRDAIEPLL
jgi:cytochrome c biogenesis protein CcmG/thiol:disulfide interchange protein DsbE